MTLDDLDWDRGEIVVHGKGQRLARLPLPADVGSALSTICVTIGRLARHAASSCGHARPDEASSARRAFAALFVARSSAPA